MEQMNKRERVRAALRGEAVDRVPASFFGHRHSVERSPDTLAAHLLASNQKFDWDFIKVQLRATYYGEAWGCKHRFDPDTHPVMVDHILKTVEDYYTLPKLDPKTGVLGQHIEVARLLGAALKGTVPYVHTLFTPLTVLNRLCGAQPKTANENDQLKALMLKNPDAIHHGLRVVTETLADYAREAIRAGADGIFMTTTSWDADHMSAEEYEVWGKPYDVAVYQAAIAEDAWFNILHPCREHVCFELMATYPVQLISYDAMSGRNPSFSQAKKITNKALWGGVSVASLASGNLEHIKNEVRAALEQTQGRNFVLGASCSVPPETAEECLLAAKAALAEWGDQSRAYSARK
jgi:uroporphyrinogen decarboxylase